MHAQVIGPLSALVSAGTEAPAHCVKVKLLLLALSPLLVAAGTNQTLGMTPCEIEVLTRAQSGDYVSLCQRLLKKVCA